MARYFVRWRTAVKDGDLVVSGWSICDDHRRQKLEIAEFGMDELHHAEAICRLMNTQEGLEHDSCSREG